MCGFTGNKNIEFCIFNVIFPVSREKGNSKQAEISFDSWGKVQR